MLGQPLLGREHGRLAGQVVAECETEQACQEQQGSDEPDDAGNGRQARLLMHDETVQNLGVRRMGTGQTLAKTTPPPSDGESMQDRGG